MPRRRRTADTSPGPVSGDIPVELRAGACIELWADPMAEKSLRTVSAFRHYHDARYAWLAAHGIGRGDAERIPPALTRQPASPWSYHYLAANRPDDLARLLQRLGLPADWEPVHVARFDYGPSLVPQKSNKWRPEQPAGEHHG